MVLAARSAAVQAETVNGAIKLGFRDPPEVVTATSANGAVTVRVPGDRTRYVVSATTVPGRVDTASVTTDPTATHTITAETVNGSITVTTAGRWAADQAGAQGAGAQEAGR